MLDKRKYLKRVIIVSWIALIACFAIKIFGGNFFDIMCHNEKFIAICTYADNHLWAYYLISCSYSLISLYFYILAICQKTKCNKIEFITILLTVLAGTYIKIMSVNWGWIFDIWQFILMPCLLNIKQPKKWLYAIIAVILLAIFQVISMLTKNLGIGMVTDNGVLISAIYSIDVVLMIILYYLYSNFSKTKKGG